jgi:CRP-like cAMP-binding protein
MFSVKKYYLTFQIGSMKESVYPLLGTTTIGRGADNTITVPDPKVSRHHAKLSFQDRTWIVEDLGSANGITVEGKRIEKLVLKTGDTFKLGEIAFSLLDHGTPDARDQFTQTVEILSASAADLEVLDDKRKTDFWHKRLHNVIATIPFFPCLDEKEHRLLTDTATLHGIKPGEIIIREGDPGRSIYAVLSGRVKVFLRDYRGSELELANLGESEFFGEMSFLTGKPRSAYVMAKEPAMVIELNYKSMRKLVQENSAAKKVLLDYYHDRLKNNEEKRSKGGLEERRKHPRLKLRLPVNLELVSTNTTEDPAGQNSWKAISVDISLSGILLGVPEAETGTFRPTQQIQLEIGLTEALEKVRTSGTIRYVKSAGRDKKIPLLAIEFVDMTPADSNKLREFIYGKDHLTD